MKNLFTCLLQKVVISRKWTENGLKTDREWTDEVAEKSARISTVWAMLWVKLVNLVNFVMQIFATSATSASANFIGKASNESTVKYREWSRIPSCLFRYSLDSHLSRFSLASLICLCMLTVGVGNVWGITVSDISTTAATTITDGGQYVVATAYNGTYLTTSVSSGWGGTTTSAGSAAIFTAHGSKTGFYLTCSAGTLAPVTSKTFNDYDTGSSNNLSINASGEIQNSSDTSWKLRLNGSFRWYSTSTGSAVYLFAVSTGNAITLNKNNSDASGSSNGSGTIAADATSLTSGFTAPTRTGYTVEGYYTTSACTTKIATAAGALRASITVSGNTWTNGSSQWKRGANETFYTKWTANTYYVRFNKNNNDATGTMSNQTFAYGTAQNLTANAFSLTGHTFAGWATTTSGTVAHTDGKSVSNLTSTAGATVDLYAKWTPINYTVTWKVNGETWTPKTTTGEGTDGSDNADYGTQVSTLPTAPNPDNDEGCGNKFMGWTNAAIDGSQNSAPGVLFTTAGDSPAITGTTVFHAVFADYGE